MRVFAIDPGFGRCGVAVLEKTSNKEVLVYSACIETSPETAFPERLREVADACRALLQTYTPDAVAMEKLFFTVNQKTAMQVAEARGAIIAEVARAHTPLFEYTPSQVKGAVSGFGGADKKQIATMLHMLVKIEKPITHDDEYDAIAVGVTHLAHSR